MSPRTDGRRRQYKFMIYFLDIFRDFRGLFVCTLIVLVIVLIALSAFNKIKM